MAGGRAHAELHAGDVRENANGELVHDEEDEFEDGQATQAAELKLEWDNPS